MTILLVEQSAAVALEVADYGYVLENGRIVLDGDAARLRDHPDIQEFYLGQSAAARGAAIATSSSTAAAGGGMAELEVERAEPALRRAGRARGRLVRRRARASCSR